MLSYDEDGMVLAHMACYGCGAVFAFNPNRVPSVVVRGRREPICRRCFDRLNARKQAVGLPVMELPDGAYEVAHESAIDWEDNRA